MSYTPKNNFNLKLKRTDAGEIGFKKKLWKTVAGTCDDQGYYFRWTPIYDSFYRNDSQEVSVVGGVGNFNWSIGDSGFSLANATTSNRTNTVYTDGTVVSNDSAVVTVEDSCGNSVSGNLKVCYNIDVPPPAICADLDNVSYDNSRSGDSVGRGMSVTIAVVDGLGPYRWEASEGFILDYAITEGLSNILTATMESCGSAIITITDACGDIATGYVLCTTGHWEDWDTHLECEKEGYGDWLSCDGTIVGNKKYKIWITCMDPCVYENGDTCPDYNCNIAWVGYMRCETGALCVGPETTKTGTWKTTYGLWVC